MLKRIKIGRALAYGAVSGAGAGLVSQDGTTALAVSAVVALVHLAFQEKYNV